MYQNRSIFLEEGSDAEMEVDNSDGEGEEESEGDEDEESEGDEEMEGDEESEGEESQRNVVQIMFSLYSCVEFTFVFSYILL